jgi:hypothetical protein
MPSTSMRSLPRPKAVLFDLFHTLACVPPPALADEAPIPEILGVPAAEWQRRYYEDDVLGRCLGRMVDSVEAMRIVTHSIDPSVPEERILAAVESRRRRFEIGLVEIEDGILVAGDHRRSPCPCRPGVRGRASLRGGVGRVMVTYAGVLRTMSQLRPSNLA